MALAAKAYIKQVFSQCHERRTTDPNYSFMLLGVGTGATCWTHPDFVDAAFIQELGKAARVSVGVWESSLYHKGNRNDPQPWGQDGGPGANKTNGEWCPPEEKVLLNNCSINYNHQQCPASLPLPSINKNASPQQSNEYSSISKAAGAKGKGRSRKGRRKGSLKRNNKEQGKRRKVEKSNGRNPEQSKRRNTEQSKGKLGRRSMGRRGGKSRRARETRTRRK